MKKIILFTNLPVWSIGANKGGRALYSTIDGYINASWEVWFISTGGNIPKAFYSKTQVVEKRYLFLDKLLSSKIRLIRGISKTIKSMLINKFYFKIGKIIINGNIDGNCAIYAYECDTVRAAKKLADRYNFPLIIRFQGTIIKPERSKEFLYRLKYKHQIRALKTKSDIVIMTNDGTQGLHVLKKFGNQSDRIEFLRNGVTKIDETLFSKRELLRQKYGIMDTDFVFITVSRLELWKKVDRAINAFNVLFLEEKNIKLLIIGDGSDKKRLEELVVSYGLNNVISFLGSVEQSNVYEYMVLSDVFLSFYNLSNVGNPLLEAMMCGKPIITLDVGDTKEIINDGGNGILIPVDEMDIIPSKMKKLICDKEYKENIAQGALKYAYSKLYTWSERMKYEINLVEALLSSKN